MRALEASSWFKNGIKEVATEINCFEDNSFFVQHFYHILYSKHRLKRYINLCFIENKILEQQKNQRKKNKQYSISRIASGEGRIKSKVVVNELSPNRFDKTGK